MQRPVSARRLVRHFLAIVFAALATTYCALWLVHMRHPRPRLGFSNYEYSASTRSITIGVVFPESLAQQAGLQTGDRIVAIDGRELDNLRPVYGSIIIGQKETVDLTVQDPRSPAGERQVELLLRGQEPAPMPMTGLQHMLELPMHYFPIGFLIVDVVVLLLRPDDPNAWLLALFCSSFVAGGPLLEGAVPVHLRGFAVAYKMVMAWSAGPFFYYLFAVFPAPSPVDRKLPWLKYALVAGALITTLPMGLRCWLAGGALPLYLNTHWPGWKTLIWSLTGQSGLPVPASHVWPAPEFIFFGFILGSMTLGLASLLSNNFLSADAQTRRKAHVMLWGTAVSTTPIIMALAATVIGGLAVVPIPLWEASILLLSFVWPLSFAYAVVKHRVLEIPVLLRRSARYVLVQRGYFVALFAAAAIAITLFTHTISRFFPAATNIGMALSAVFGIVLVWASAPVVKRGTERIDRAFFRSAYDARLILQNLAEKTRSVTDRHELARLLQIQIEGALHPKSLACYLEDGTGNLVAESAEVPAGSEKAPTTLPRPRFPVRFGARFLHRDLDTIPATSPLLGELAHRGKAWDVPPAVSDEAGYFGPLAPECLVPILGRNSRLIGLLVLGQRLSEEPYSGEDKHLLDSVASQAGITLENIDLARNMAERIEAERRIAHDMEIAKQVQARLFPQKLPPLERLEYAGRCIQARDVGGDYYDFLSLGEGRVGIVLADVVGKGIPGALLMANLQAAVRSQCAIASQDMPQFLKSVNQAFYESTDEGGYATLFFGDYQDSTRRMRFANCGHNPPLLLRHNGTAERLAATATVLGLFEKWDSTICEVEIGASDVLVIYTDGVTEANNSAGEEFGENRLLETIRASRALPVPQMVDAILAAALNFSQGEMRDDLTLVVARGR
jgi:serine phosphatase RsbU (regulator of sigma subunit)